MTGFRRSWSVFLVSRETLPHSWRRVIGIPAVLHAKSGTVNEFLILRLRTFPGFDCIPVPRGTSSNRGTSADNEAPPPTD
jgi:hypothetical protein